MPAAAVIVFRKISRQRQANMIYESTFSISLKVTVTAPATITKHSKCMPKARTKYCCGHPDPLLTSYPIRHPDFIVVKVRQDKRDVHNKAVYLAV